MILTLCHPCDLSEIPCGTYVCHNVGECGETSVLSNFILNEFFKDSVGLQGCVDIVSHPMYRR